MKNQLDCEKKPFIDGRDVMIAVIWFLIGLMWGLFS